jgi:hypothetical protein
MRPAEQLVRLASRPAEVPQTGNPGKLDTLAKAIARHSIRTAPAHQEAPGECATLAFIAMADDELKAELERLRAENDRLKQQRSRAVTMKVSEKGGVSVYGLGRFPVTLYKEQWVKLLDMADDIRAFIRENESKLKSKGSASE